MGDYAPLYFSVMILLLVGVLLPLVIAPFTAGKPSQDSLLTPMVELVDDGACIDVPLLFFGNKEFCFSPFSWFGDEIKLGFVTYFSAFTYIPPVILIPLIIIMMLGFTYTIIKLLPTT